MKPKIKLPALVSRFGIGQIGKIIAELPPLTSSIIPFFVGLLLLSAGAFWAWPPAGLIAPGLVLIYVALAGDTERTT